VRTCTKCILGPRRCIINTDKNKKKWHLVPPVGPTERGSFYGEYLSLLKVKVKFALDQVMKAQRGWRYSSTLSLTLALEGGGWLRPRSCRFTPGKETQYPLYRQLGGPQGRYGRVWKISSPPLFDPRTVHTVASWYTDCVRNNWELQTTSHKRIYFDFKCKINR
jgi:hypothetical protein